MIKKLNAKFIGEDKRVLNYLGELNGKAVKVIIVKETGETFCDTEDLAIALGHSNTQELLGTDEALDEINEMTNREHWNKAEALINKVQDEDLKNELLFFFGLRKKGGSHE